MLRLVCGCAPDGDHLVCIGLIGHRADHSHIHQANPEAPRSVLTTIYEGCSHLEGFPHRGRTSRIPGRRELVFP